MRIFSFVRIRIENENLIIETLIFDLSFLILDERPSRLVGDDDGLAA